MSSPISASSLADLYASGFTALRQQFEAVGDGLAALQARSALLDRIISDLYRGLISEDLQGPVGFCLVALGGYGRRELFPYSDVDLLFLSEPAAGQTGRKEALAVFSRILWDLGLRVAQRSATPGECGALDRSNPEWSVSLLDSRRVAGSAALFGQLRAQVIPRLVRRDGPDLLRGLLEMTSRRHAKFGDTLFHLEPNVKDSPGALRDHHVARWLTVLSELEREGRWVKPEEAWPARMRPGAEAAFRFIAAARCFLHFSEERDDNHLTYELHERAAALGIGMAPGASLAPEEWMRHYFRHARAVNRLLQSSVEAVLPRRASLLGLYQDWKSRVANADFSVVRGRLFFRQPAAANDPHILLRAFEFMARHGLELSLEAERLIEGVIERQQGRSCVTQGLWQAMSGILTAPHAVPTLRTMHRLGVLEAFLPEFCAIDALVVRDFYHRYTVDEHSLQALQNLGALRDAREGWESRFGRIFASLERPELLFFALLLHDVGKGMRETDHIRGSLRAADQAMDRWNVPPEDRETVQFLIENHLQMSGTMLRRDLFDPTTPRLLAELTSTHERLKMLTLLTYADIKSVHPAALTPWKAEMLWQLYVAVANALTRRLDSDRVTGGESRGSKVNRLKSLVASEERGALWVFLEGFPRRYLELHAPEEILAHYEMAKQLDRSPIQTGLKNKGAVWELRVVTRDRPGLFALLAGTLAGWGANIIQADAFSNRAQTVLDTFRFVDLYRTLDLNPGEAARLQQNITDVVTGARALDELLRGRLNAPSHAPKVEIPTQVRFDSAASSRSTLLELITRDRPGLLHQAASILSASGANIELALIDTEGQKAVDVFYLTWGGKTLDPAKQASIQEALLKQFETR